MHYFVSVYFNYNNYESRYRLTKEFLERYPEVHLIEVAYGDKPFVINHCNTTQVREINPGFITQRLLNNFIIKNYETIDSITLIDSDLILPENYFDTVRNQMDKYSDSPYVAHGFSKCTDNSPNKKNQKIHYMSLPSSLLQYYDNFTISNSYTGYVWSYNKKFLDRLGIYLFPECLILGAFDYVFVLCILMMKDTLMSLTDNIIINTDLEYLYNRAYGTNMGIIDCEIRHEYHGNKINRGYNSRWGIYDKLYHDSDEPTDWGLVKKYFSDRKEDD